MAHEGFSFPVLPAAEIVEQLHSYGIAPNANLCTEDINKPGSDLLPGVFSLFLAEIGCGENDQQLGFEVLERLDNPEHFMEPHRKKRLFQSSKKFLESIQFHGFTFRDFTHPTPRGVMVLLSAVINYLHYRRDKIALLQPILDKFTEAEERSAELNSKIAEHQKAIEDHELEEQMSEPVVQQYLEEIKGLQQKNLELNKQQGALRAQHKAIDDEIKEISNKISKADFGITEETKIRSNLLSKIVQSPEKLKSALEEKKAQNAELKNQEKILMQKNQKKKNTLEMYSKACEKLSKHYSKICAVQEQAAAAKAVEEEVKSLKVKIRDQNLEIDHLNAKIVESQRKVFETEERLKSKEKERDERISDNSRKMAAFKSEMERKQQGLEDRRIKVEEMYAKGCDLLSQADSVEAAAEKKQAEIYENFELLCKAANRLIGRVERAVAAAEEVER